MEISESWLREWVDPAIDSDTLMSQLTMAGLEVDGWRDAAPALDGVVVADVVKVEQHPNADKLSRGPASLKKPCFTNVICAVQQNHFVVQTCSYQYPLYLSWPYLAIHEDLILRTIHCSTGCQRRRQPTRRRQQLRCPCPCRWRCACRCPCCGLVGPGAAAVVAGVRRPTRRREGH